MEEHRRFLIERQRANSYRLLAACFYPPSKKLLARDNLFEDLSASLKSLCYEAALHAGEMYLALMRSSNEELEMEYSRLFSGPLKKTSMFGPDFFEHKRRMPDDTGKEIKNFYEKIGREYASNQQKEPSDLFAMELEFVSYLSAKIAEAVLDGNTNSESYYINIRKEFFAKFLDKWFLLFLETVQENAHHDLYRSLAKCTKSYFISEKINKEWQ